jgi:hypothetical protein
MPRPLPKDKLNWLNSRPSLDQLMERYPAEWEMTGRELVSAMEDGRAERLSDYARKAKSEWDFWKSRIKRSHGNPAAIEAALPHLIRNRMALLALEKCHLAAATGTKSGKIRFNLVNGLLIQKLLFSSRLARKPASLWWFRLCWPLITQKRILMPLVQPKGIYCFYTSHLIQELAGLIGRRPCLEIGAGDGTLSRFLGDAGIRIRATDDYSWNHTIQYPEAVEKLNARQALQRYQPEAVVCSWPPPGNGFECHVFNTRSVQLYIVIGSRYRFASGNWEAYTSQALFEWNLDQRLSRYVLPPELDNAVLLFRRRIKT